jgi:hypothetical protein
MARRDKPMTAVQREALADSIFEMNVESYSRRAALKRKRGPGRPPIRATAKTAT